MTLALKINEVLRERSLMLWLDAYVCVEAARGGGAAQRPVTPRAL